MTWKKEVFQNFKLYAVTDIRTMSTPGQKKEILSKVEAAYRGGADIVQLRAKGLSDYQLMDLGRSLKKIAERWRKLFFLNDRPDLAIALRADGVHIGQEDFSIPAVRKLARLASWDLFIGKSTHSLQQAVEAEKEGADYIAVGPVFATPTKPDYPAVGLDLLKKVSHNSKIPFVAIGGINLLNLHAVLKTGARRIAGVRSIFGAKNPYENTRKIKTEIQNSKI